jgi:cholesterol transport system auxiliary component
VSYYATHQWVESPPRMLAPLLVQALERTGAWKSVVQVPTIVVGDYRLESDQFTLEQRFFEQPNRVRVALRAQLLDLKQYGVVGTKWFEVFEVAPSEDADGGVTAANRAAGRLLDDVAIWASGCVKHSEDC